jgi:uncharacterized UBP type Zn finger protein
VYCYTCDESRVDPSLPEHLAHFGMDVVDMRKTDKSMTELVSAERDEGLEVGADLVCSKSSII